MDINTVKDSFNSAGYKLLTKEYRNQTQRLEYICPNGHKRATTWKSWKRGRRCLICKNQRTRPALGDVRKSFEREGYTLLSTEYVNNKTKLKYICPNGHNNSITWADWNVGGYRCPYCANNKRLPIESVLSDFESEGYTLIRGEYFNNTSSLVVSCPEGHEFETSRVRWTAGSRCPICYKDRININVVRESFEKQGYVLLSKEYVNAHTKLKYICDKGHKHKISWAAWQQGERCYRCSKTGTSQQEQEIINFIKELNLGVKIRNRGLISPQELDVVIPSEKVAIEYCGLYWHSELMGKTRSYHSNKQKDCADKSYRLITIFEDEWKTNEDLVRSRLRGIFGKTENVIYARKTQVRKISTQEAREFCEANHLQGYTGASVKLGLFYNEELVSVMTFAVPSLSKGQKGIKHNIWELSRFCSSINTSVVGGASKLLSYFKKNYNWEEIFSYADMRWSLGDLYEKIGFDLVKQTPPNYWYFKSGIKRIHRFVLRKKPTESKDKTEWELRQEQGYNRIWDCGSLKYVMYNN